MKPDVTINFCVRSNFRTKEKTHPVFVSGRVQKTRGYIGSTDIQIPSDMKIVNNRCVGGSPTQRRRINAQIDEQLELLSECVDYLKGRNLLTLPHLKELYQKGGASRLTFTDLCDDYLRYEKSRVGGLITKQSYGVYANAGRNFRMFLESKDLMGLSLDEITNETIEQYITYLSVERGLKQQSINSLIGLLKSYFIYGVEKDLVRKSPMTHFAWKREPSQRVFLSRSEISMLSHCPLTDPKLICVRDSYLFACLTGLSFSDLRSLSLMELVTLSDKTWIYRSRKKTKRPFEVPLLPQAQALIDKYADKDHPSRPIFSQLPDNYTSNQAIRIIAAKAGITKRLTFHTARHTFATLALSEGVSMESVSKMLGHASIRTTAIYARITNSKVAREMAEFEKKLGPQELWQL